MKIHNVKQGSPEWIALRLGIPTASELGNLITDKGQVRKGEMPRTYLMQKVCERWLGQPLFAFGGGAIEQGSLLEPEAIPWLCLEMGVDVKRPGFITDDTETLGCSPDAWVHGRYGVEVKCPQPINHLKWLRSGECPEEHMLQCQGGMFVTGLDRWLFVSYRRDMPSMVVEVAKDNKYQDAILEATEQFTNDFAELFAWLLERNGGKTYLQEKQERDAAYVF